MPNLVRFDPRALAAFILVALLPALASAQGWTFIRTGVPGVVFVSDIAYGNGRFVASTGGGPTPVIVSDDAITWRAVPGISGIGPKLLFIAGSFYAIGNGQIWRSSDGATWTHVVEGTAPGSGHAFAATDGRGILTSASTSNAELLVSPDMRTFRPAAPLPRLGTPGTFSMITGVTFGAGRYFVSYMIVPIVPGNSTGYIVSSVDGSAWTEIATGLTTNFHMAGTKDRFVAFVDSSHVLISTSGTSATPYPLPFPLSNGDNLVAAGGRFFMSRSLVSSLDGLAWAPLAPALPPTNSDLRGFAYGKGRYVSVGLTQTTPPLDVIAYLAAPALPVFATQPASTTIVEGRTVTLTATLDNPDVGTTFQWRRDGVPIPGATLPAYTVPAAPAATVARFTLEARNALGATQSDVATVTVVPVSAGGRIVNLSVLSTLDEPDSHFTVGFVIGGQSGTKPVLLRAAGPSLTRFGIATPHPDPRLELFTGPAKVAENDNWSGSSDLTSAAVQVGAFPYIASDSRDAALYAGALAPGNHTLRISSGPGTGSALAEVYDATPSAFIGAATPRLVNVSVLKPLGANASLNAGFVIGGSTPQVVLIRATGPSLGGFGVTAPLADPRLILHQIGFQTPLAINDDWSASAATSAAQFRATFAAVGAFDLPATSRDAALLVTLEPGNYVAEAKGAPNTTGSVLVEVYEVRE